MLQFNVRRLVGAISQRWRKQNQSRPREMTMTATKCMLHNLAGPNGRHLVKEHIGIASLYAESA